MAERGKAIPPKDKQRVAELLGLGLTMEEAGGAKGISRASVDRIMAQPEYRKIRDDMLKQRTSMKVEVAAVLRSALTATDDDGNPIHSARQRAAELYAKNPELFDLAEGLDDDEDGMLPGVVLTFPVQLDPNVPPGTVQVRNEEDDVVAEVVGMDDTDRLHDGPDTDRLHPLVLGEAEYNALDPEQQALYGPIHEDESPTLEACFRLRPEPEPLVFTEADIMEEHRS